MNENTENNGKVFYTIMGVIWGLTLGGLLALAVLVYNYGSYSHTSDSYYIVCDLAEGDYSYFTQSVLYYNENNLGQKDSELYQDLNAIRVYIKDTIYVNVYNAMGDSEKAASAELERKEIRDSLQYLAFYPDIIDSDFATD